MEKGRKDCSTAVNIPVNGVRLRSIRRRKWGKRSIFPIKGNDMDGTGKNRKLPGEDDGKEKKPPPAPAEDDDYEDGDFATPKRDRNGDDDQPL
jgi:hypothetical protein